MKNNYLLKLFLFVLICAGANSVNAQSNVLATGSSGDATLYVLDTTNFDVLNQLSLVGTLGESFDDAYSLTRDSSGDYYSIFTYLNGSTFRFLGKININTGKVTIIDTLKAGSGQYERMSNLAYANNTLFGTAGAGSTTPQGLFRINTSTAAITIIDTLNEEGYGASLGYCSDNQMLYSWSRDSLYKIDPVTYAITRVAYDTAGLFGGASNNYAQSMLYIGNGNFLVSGYYDYGDFWIADTLGNIVSSGKTYDSGVSNIRGLVYMGQSHFTIEGPNSFCLNDPNGILYAGLVGDNYHWTVDGDTIAGAYGLNYMPTVSGYYNCWVNINGDLDTAAVGIQVTVKPLPVVTISGDTTLCEGSFVTLTGASGGTLQWFLDGDTIPGANSTTYNATMPGIYNQIKTNTNGCSDSAATGLTVLEIAAPAVDVTADDADFCPGFGTVLRASGTHTYTWNVGGTSDTLAVAPAITTTYTLTGTDTITGCSKDTSILITVFVPSVNITPDTFALCSGDSTVLRASGALSYVWDGGSTNDTLKVIPTITTTYTVIGTDANTCIDTATYTMFVNGSAPLVSASADDTAICMGTSTMLRATGTNIVNYMWSTLETDSVISVSPTSQTTYEIIVTNGCGSDTAWVQVDVDSLPVVNFSLVLTNDTLCNTAVSFSLTGTPSGGSFSGTGVSGSIYTPSLAVAGWNVITYSFTDGNGCSGSAMDSLFIVNCVGINDVSDWLAKLELFPNPSTGSVTIRSGKALGIIVIYNSLGEVIYTTQTVNTSFIFDLSGQPAGIYFVRSNESVIKLIRE